MDVKFIETTGYIKSMSKGIFMQGINTYNGVDFATINNGLSKNCRIRYREASSSDYGLAFVVNGTETMYTSPTFTYIMNTLVGLNGVAINSGALNMSNNNIINCNDIIANKFKIDDDSYITNRDGGLSFVSTNEECMHVYSGGIHLNKLTAVKNGMRFDGGILDMNHNEINNVSDLYLNRVIMKSNSAQIMAKDEGLAFITNNTESLYVTNNYINATSVIKAYAGLRIEGAALNMNDYDINNCNNACVETLIFRNVHVTDTVSIFTEQTGVESSNLVIQIGDNTLEDKIVFRSDLTGDACCEILSAYAVNATKGRVDVNGDIHADKVYNAVWNDYAEWFEKDNGLIHEPGDIIVSNGDKYELSSKQYQSTVVGVHSDSYGHILGATGEEEQDVLDNIPIGLSGRVYVKITGKINVGDLIVTSDVPGVGMKCDNYVPGTVLGKALENKSTDEVGKIKMLIMNC